MTEEQIEEHCKEVVEPEYREKAIIYMKRMYGYLTWNESIQELKPIIEKENE